MFPLSALHYSGRSYIRGVKVKWLSFTKYDRRHGNPVKLETTEAEADDAYEQRYICRKPAYSLSSSILKFIHAIISRLFGYSPE
jgi:hypothetical protein